MSAQKTVLNIEGMTCSHCAASVKNALEEVDEVSGVTVDLEGKKAYFTIKNQENIEKAIAAVNASGYKAQLPER